MQVLIFQLASNWYSNHEIFGSHLRITLLHSGTLREEWLNHDSTCNAPGQQSCSDVRGKLHPMASRLWVAIADGIWLKKGRVSIAILSAGPFPVLDIRISQRTLDWYHQIVIAALLQLCCPFVTNILVSFPRIPFSGIIKLREAFPCERACAERVIMKLSVAKHYGCKCVLALWSYCKHTQSSESRLFSV